MVKSLASPPHRILLFLQQSSVEWCSSLWLDAIREIDSSFRRTIIVVSKFDNRLKVCSITQLCVVIHTDTIKVASIFKRLVLFSNKLLCDTCRNLVTGGKWIAI